MSHTAQGAESGIAAHYFAGLAVPQGGRLVNLQHADGATKAPALP